MLSEALVAAHPHVHDLGHVPKVVDVPASPALATQVTVDPCPNAAWAPGRAGVDVPAGGEGVGAQAPDFEQGLGWQVKGQGVGAGVHAIHSYLSYLRDRIVIAKELLADSGSVFIQISDDNVHRVRAILDEVFGSDNFVSLITIRKTGGLGSSGLTPICDFLLWYAKSRAMMTFNRVYARKADVGTAEQYKMCLEPNGSTTGAADRQSDEARLWQPTSVHTMYAGVASCLYHFSFDGKQFKLPPNRQWSTTIDGMTRVYRAGRLSTTGSVPRYVRFLDDHPVSELTTLWDDLMGTRDKIYTVQTNERIVDRCMLMVTNPSDLVLDPTCGSGTTAYVAEQRGRRWITIDTSRVAISLARQRLMTATFDRFRIEGEDDPLANGKGVDPGRNFVYKTVPHITLGSIARNESLDPIFAKHKPIFEEKLEACNAALKQVKPDLRTKLEKRLLAKQKAEGKRAITDADQRRWLLPPDNRGTTAERKKKQKDYTVDLESPAWYEWEVPFDTDPDWPKPLQDAVTQYRKAWRAKMDEVNKCIADNAEQETLVDQPEVVKGVVRVSGPFTVEAVQPPEMSLGDASPVEVEADTSGGEGMFDGEPGEMQTWEVREVEPLNEMEVKNVEAYLDKMVRLMKMDGVRFPNNRQMTFSRLEPIYEVGSSSAFHAEGRWVPAGEEDDDPEGDATVAVVIGPQYGPVTSPLIVEAMRTAFRRGYTDVVFAGFSFDAAAQSEIEEYKDTKVKPHLAHIRPDVNPEMAPLLKEQPGNQLFTVFGLPRISVSPPNDDGEYQVTMEGVDIYNPVDNSIQSTGANKVAAWFLDADYDGQTFCITQAFFPDRSAWDKLARALKGVVDEDAFEALSGTTSLPFPIGKHKRVAVKVIDPRGNEVMAVEEIASVPE